MLSPRAHDSKSGASGRGGAILLSPNLLIPEGWPVIPGRYGRLEWHDGETVAVYSDRPRLCARLWAVPGIHRWQVGDQEARDLGGSPETLRTPHSQGDFRALGARLAPEAGSR